MLYFSFSLSNFAHPSLSGARAPAGLCSSPLSFSLSYHRLVLVSCVRALSLPPAGAALRRASISPPTTTPTGVHFSQSSVYAESSRALVESFRRFRIIAPRRVASRRSFVPAFALALISIRDTKFFKHSCENDRGDDDDRSSGVMIRHRVPRECVALDPAKKRDAIVTCVARLTVIAHHCWRL